MVWINVGEKVEPGPGVVSEGVDFDVFYRFGVGDDVVVFVENEPAVMFIHKIGELLDSFGVRLRSRFMVEDSFKSEDVGSVVDFLRVVQRITREEAGSVDRSVPDLFFEPRADGYETCDLTCLHDRIVDECKSFIRQQELIRGVSNIKKSHGDS